MHLTLPFPASVDDLADFIAAARQLGGTALEIHIDGEPVGHDAPDDSTALVVVLSGVAQLAAPPEPAPAPEPPPATTTAKPPDEVTVREAVMVKLTLDEAAWWVSTDLKAPHHVAISAACRAALAADRGEA